MFLHTITHLLTKNQVTMKKILSFLAAAVAVFAVASCQNDGLDVVKTGDAMVTVTVGVNDGLATRSADSSVDQLVYAVYTAANELVAGPVSVENAFDGGAQNIELALANGQTYNVAFWAQNSECEAYNVVAGENGLSVEVDYNGLNNDMSRDAFFASELITVEGNVAIDVVLRRPFAKINLGVTAEDWTAAQAAGIGVTESKVVIGNAPTTLNINNGEVSGEAAVTYDFAAIPTAATKAADAQDFVVNGKTYKLLSSSYILADEFKSVINEGVQFTLNTTNGTSIVVEEGLNNVPVQRNYATNVVGTALTSKVSVNVSTDSNEYGATQIPAGDVAAFKAALANPAVGEIVLPYGEYRGMFVILKGSKTIKAADPTKKPVITGKIGVAAPASASFENIEFKVDTEYSVANTGHQYLDKFQRKSIIPIYAAKVKLSGCVFTDLYNSHQVVAVNYGAHKAGMMLEIDKCSFQGFAYAIYSRALLKVTNSTFDLFHSVYNPRTIFLYGLGDGNQGYVEFIGNTFKCSTANGKPAYCMEMSSANYNYKNICYNVKNNPGFGVNGEYFLPRTNDGVCNFEGTTFATGSATFSW